MPRIKIKKPSDAKVSALDTLLQELSQEEVQTGLLKAKHPVGTAIGSEDVRGDLERALITYTLREALSSARKARAVSLETLAKQQGISKERASQIERAEEKLELQTLLRHVAALDYEVSLTLTPKDGKGQTITAKLRQ